MCVVVVERRNCTVGRRKVVFDGDGSWQVQFIDLAGKRSERKRTHFAWRVCPLFRPRSPDCWEPFIKKRQRSDVGVGEAKDRPMSIFLATFEVEVVLVLVGTAILRAVLVVRSR